MSWNKPFKSDSEMCFAWEQHRCRLLAIGKCGGKKCSSYKTEEQCKEENKKCWQRILSLPVEKKADIFEKYYPNISQAEIEEFEKES